MAHHKSAKKAIRQTERRSAVNKSRTSRVRNFIKKVETAIESGDKKVAAAAQKDAQPEMHARRAHGRGSSQYGRT